MLWVDHLHSFLFQSRFVHYDEISLQIIPCNVILQTMPSNCYAVTHMKQLLKAIPDAIHCSLPQRPLGSRAEIKLEANPGLHS